MPAETSPLRIVSLTVGPFQENTYLVVDQGTGEAVLIDPGAEPERILALIEASGARLTDIWITHAHLDHIGAIAAIKRRHDVSVHLHPLDRPVYDVQNVFAEAYGLPFEAPAPPDRDLAHGDIMRVGNTEFRVIHTPGHAPGHVIFHGPGVILGGDLLFAGSIGRTDLPMASPDHMVTSLETVAALPPESVVYPGHGPATTIARERRDNPFLNGTAHVRRDES